MKEAEQDISKLICKSIIACRDMLRIVAKHPLVFGGLTYAVAITSLSYRYIDLINSREQRDSVLTQRVCDLVEARCSRAHDTVILDKLLQKSTSQAVDLHKTIQENMITRYWNQLVKKP